MLIGFFNEKSINHAKPAETTNVLQLTHVRVGVIDQCSGDASFMYSNTIHTMMPFDLKLTCGQELLNVWIFKQVNWLKKIKKSQDNLPKKIVRYCFYGDTFVGFFSQFLYKSL